MVISRRCSTPATPGRSAEPPGGAVPGRLGNRQDVDRDDRLGLQHSVADERPLTARLLDLRDHRAGEHEGAVAVGRGPDLDDLAVGHPGDDAPELRGCPLDGPVDGRRVLLFDHGHGRVLQSFGGSERRTTPVVGVSPTLRSSDLPRTGYSERWTSIETMAPGRMKRSSI